MEVYLWIPFESDISRNGFHNFHQHFRQQIIRNYLAYITAQDTILYRAVFNCVSAAPAPIGGSVWSLFHSGNETVSAFPTNDLSGKQIPIWVTFGCVWPPATFPDLKLHQLPQIPRYDRRMMISNNDFFLFTVIIFSVVGQIIRSNGLLLNKISDVFFIMQDLYDVAATPDRMITVGLNACFPTNMPITKFVWFIVECL